MRRSLSLAALAAAAIAVLAGPSPALAAGTTVTVRDSDYGPMLWAPARQAIYMFDRDGPDRSRCYGPCARAWPPVLTKGKPRAGAGTDPALLSTTRRRDGSRQVTYAGKPLYTYAHEGPNQVFCHDIRLNGGWWYVLQPDGQPAP